MAVVRQMVAQPNSWAKIKAADGGNATSVAKKPTKAARAPAAGSPLALVPGQADEAE